MLEENNTHHKESSTIMLYNLRQETFEEPFLGPTEGEELKANLCNYIFLLSVFSIESTKKKKKKKFQG